MSRQRGDKLGPYEIIAAIGAGGMGEVYPLAIQALSRRSDQSLHRTPFLDPPLQRPQLSNAKPAWLDLLQVLKQRLGLELVPPRAAAESLPTLRRMDRVVSAIPVFASISLGSRRSRRYFRAVLASVPASARDFHRQFRPNQAP